MLTLPKPMMTILPPIIITLLIPTLLLLLTSTLNWPTTPSLKNRDLSSPFECGFSPLNKARLPFSLRFFLLAVLFLVFDIEIVIILPVVMLKTWHPFMLFTPPLILFLMILILGLFHEWNEGSLDWAD